MFRIVLFLLLTTFYLESAEYNGPLEVPDNNFDVLEYRVLLNLYDYDSTEVDGVCWTKIKFENNDDLEYIFHLENLEVDRILQGGKELNFEKIMEDDEELFHYKVLIEDYADTVEIEIYYSGFMNSENETVNSWGGVHYSNDILYALGVGFNNKYVSTTRHWLPCFDHPFDKAKFEAEFRVGHEEFAVSCGLLSDEFITKDFKSISWKQDLPCATYLLTFAVGDYEMIEFHSDSFPDLPMQVFSKPKDTNNVKKNFSRLPEMVEVFSGFFVDYPFEKVGYVITPKGAMEHQTMVSFPSGKVNSGGIGVIAHELAHQWFGDLVTCSDFRHAWLNESFATYCESLWFGAMWDSKKDYLNDLKGKKSSYLSTVSVNDGILPLYDFSREKPSSNYPQTIYIKGAVVLGMLRYEVGDDMFFLSINNYLEKYKYSTATTEKLLAEFNANTLVPIDWFFEQWIYGKGWPKYKVFSFRDDNKTYIKFKEVQSNEWNKFENVAVEISYKIDNEQFSKVVRVGENSIEFIIDGLIDDNKLTFNGGNEVISLYEIESFTSAGRDDVEDVKIRIFPNPVDSNITIINDYDAEFDVYILDLMGNRVETGTIRKGNNSFDLSSLVSGTYNIVVENGNFYMNKKIIKN